jgi:hypothetical protein
MRAALSNCKSRWYAWAPGRGQPVKKRPQMSATIFKLMQCNAIHGRRHPSMQTGNGNTTAKILFAMKNRAPVFLPLS